MTSSPARVAIATFDDRASSMGAGGLAGALRALDPAIDVTVVRIATRPRRFRRPPVLAVAVDHHLSLTRRRMDLAAWPAAGRRRRQRLLRRATKSAAALVIDPEAAALLPFVRPGPLAIVVHVADPSWRLARLGLTDREALMAADLWLTTTAAQAEELGAAGLHARVFGMDLAEPHPMWQPDDEGPIGPVVLSTPSEAWDTLAHTVEIVAQLRHLAPRLPLVWLTDPGSDAWLARHDLDRLTHLDPPVAIHDRTEPMTTRPCLVLRTGYEASDPRLVVQAALAGVPTLGFEVDDLPPSARLSVPPFAVEDLVDQALHLMDDPRRLADTGDRVAAATRAHLAAQTGLSDLVDLLGAVSSPTDLPRARAR